MKLKESKFKRCVHSLDESWQRLTTKLLEKSWRNICPNLITTEPNYVDLARKNEQTSMMIIYH